MSLSVLFVCTANICRSPYMELRARQLVGPDADVVFSSAGTHGRRDEPMSEEMRAPLTRAGVAAEQVDVFRSRRLDRSIIAGVDLVLTAERAHRTYVLDDHPELGRRVLTLGQAAAAADQLTVGADGGDALAELARHRGASDPADDVADPYRRAPEVADGCAAVVDGMLGRLLPVLLGRALGSED